MAQSVSMREGVRLGLASGGKWIVSGWVLGEG